MKETENKTKSVFFFIDSLGGGGAERVISIICNSLAKNNDYSVSVIMLRKKKIAYELSEKVKLLYAEELPVTSIYGRMVRRSFSIYRRLRQGIFKPLMLKLKRYEKISKIDETPFFFYASYAMPYREFLKNNLEATAFGVLIRSNIAMLMAAKGTGVRTVFCERNNPVRPDIPYSLLKMRNHLYKHAEGAIFQTEDQKRYYKNLKGKSLIILNPVKENLPDIFHGERRHEIINFCRLNKQKNIPLLINAFELLQKEYSDYILRIWGEGPEKENLTRYIKKRNLEKVVYFEDFKSNIHEIICDAAMFVSTSDFEGLSNSMIEAMAIGLPCVCTDCAGGGARMMIQDHVNGILVPVGDVQAVYKGMKEIIENKELAENLSKEASKVREQLSISKIADQWEVMIK